MIICKSIKEFIKNYKDGISFSKLSFSSVEMYEALVKEILISDEPILRYNLLGTCYLRGKGVGKNYKKAFMCYLEGANYNEPRIMRNLAKAYEIGQGTERNMEKAFMWYFKAANLGDKKALCNVGFMYDNGFGIEKNPALAMKYYFKSAELGYDGAMSDIAYCYQVGHNVEMDKGKALEYYTKAAKLNNRRSLYNLGLFYLKGDVVDKNEEVAFKCFFKASEQGYSRAYYQLGLCYQNGVGANANLAEAIKYYKLASLASIAKASYNLGLIYEDNKEYKESLKYYKLSLKQGYQFAAYKLGQFYYYGYGDGIDLELAYEYFKKAIGSGYPMTDSILKEIKAKIEVENESEGLHLAARKDVFISWNHDDKLYKNQICDYLEGNAIATVWDSDENSSGPLANIIVDAIMEAKVFVVIVTGNSIKSKWVNQELNCFYNKVGKNKDLINCIVPIYINEVNKNHDAFDIMKGIDELPEASIFRHIKELKENSSGVFIDDKNSLDLARLKKSIQLGLASYSKIMYRERIKKHFESFNANLSVSFDDDFIAMNAILDFNKCYINRRLYVNDVGYEPEEVLRSPISLIYAEGGLGKSLYLKSLLRNYFDNNNYMFYLECREIALDIEKSYDFTDILMIHSFNNYFEGDFKINRASFIDIINSKNNVLLLIDALDEINTDRLNLLLEKIGAFKRKYPFVKIIFTSRLKSYALKINDKIGKPVAYELRGLNDVEMEHMFKNIKEHCQSLDNENQMELDSISEEAFFNSLDLISSDIKKNPLLLSSLLYIYISTNKLLSKKYEIIDKSNKILIDEIERDRDIAFEYKEYIKNGRLVNLLGYLSYKMSFPHHPDAITIIKDYLNKARLLKPYDDSEDVAYSIFNYLQGRRIINKNGVYHKLFRDYYSASYIFNSSFEKEYSNTIDWYKYMNSSATDFVGFLEASLKNDNEPWPAVAANLITKLDFEVMSIDNSNIMNSTNRNYPLFNDVLEKAINGNPSFSKLAKETIKGLCDKELLYFNEFIKEYFNR